MRRMIMKKFFAYLLLFSFLIVSLSACAHKDDPPVGETTQEAKVLQFTADAGVGAVTLDWQMLKGAVTYNLYYIEDSGGTYTLSNRPSSSVMKAGTEIPGLISALEIISGLSNGTKYWFALSGVNSVGTESDLSMPITATPSTNPPPAAPSNVRASAGNAQITVTWDTMAGATSYNIYYYKFDNSLYSQVYPVTGVTSPYSGPYSSDLPIINTTNENPLAYFFFVTAVNANGESYPSFEVYAVPSDPPPPAAPVITVTAVGSTSVSIDWADVAGATSYNVYSGTAKGVTKNGYGAMATGTGSGFTATGLITDTKYYFVVTAVDASGNESTESNEVWAIPSATAPDSGYSVDVVVTAHTAP